MNKQINTSNLKMERFCRPRIGQVSGLHQRHWILGSYNKWIQMSVCSWQFPHCFSTGNVATVFPFAVQLPQLSAVPIAPSLLILIQCPSETGLLALSIHTDSWVTLGSSGEPTGCRFLTAPICHTFFPNFFHFNILSFPCILISDWSNKKKD